MQDTDKKGKNTLLSRLMGATALGSWAARTPLPKSVIDFMRLLGEEDHPDFNAAASENTTSSYYQAAKERMNRLWAGYGGAHVKPDPNEPQTPTSRFKTLRGVLGSYWTSEKWADAWASTAGIAAVSTLNAQNTVWVAEAAAQFINSVATISTNDDPTMAVLKSGGTLAGYVTLQILCGWASMKGSMELSRKMSGWMTGKFTEAVFAQHDTVQRLTHNREKDSTEPDAMPDNPAQRLGYTARQISRNLVNLGEGAFSMVMTSAFIGYALYDKSVPVTALDDMGRALNNVFPNGMIDFVPGKNGTALLAGAVAAAYMAATLRKALKIGKEMQQNETIQQRSDGTYYETLTDTFQRGHAIAASKGHHAQLQATQKAYAAVDDAWKKDSNLFTRYITFMNAQQSFGTHVVATLPGLAGSISKNLPFQGFLESHTLVSSFISQVNYVFNAIPQHAYMISASKRMQEMAVMIDKVQNKKNFYSLSGVHDFEETTVAAGENTPAVRLKNLQMFHRGERETPLLSIDDLSIGHQDWIYMKGLSGIGKTSLMKCVAGLWPYGKGTIEIAENAKFFYAHQEADISGDRTLAEHLLYGAPGEEFVPANLNSELSAMTENHQTQRARLLTALTDAGLGAFATGIDEKTHGKKPWSEVLSGGQKQRLVLARILFQNPDVILLDEAASHLHPAGRKEFFATIKEKCPQACVMAIVHDDQMPTNDAGQNFFNKVLTLENGTARLSDLENAAVRVSSRTPYRSGLGTAHI